MSEADRQKWQSMYESGRYRPRALPTSLLEEWLPALPRGRALDIACGAGRHALRLAEAGFEVLAVDIAAAALEQARAAAAERRLEVCWQLADLDDFEPEPGGYDLVVCVRYVNRRLLPRLRGALKPGGWLVYEHHLLTQLAVDGPRDPDFRLAPNELLATFAPLRVMAYREHLLTEPDGKRMAIAQMVACNGAGGL